MSARIVIVAASALWASASNIAVAYEEAEPAPAGHRIALGVGHWGALSPLEGAPEDPEKGFFPWISYESQRLSVDPTGISVRLRNEGPLTIEAMLSPRWLMVDPDDSTLHADLRRRTSLDLGGLITLAAGPALFSLGYRGDISGRIDGHEVSAETAIGMGLPGGGELGLKAGAYWRDRNLGTYLYGVRADEARADRPQWTVRGITPFAGLMVSYPIAGGWQATFAAETEFLTGRAADSPIIARKVVPSAFIGLFYSF
jgi:MipA family protein